MVEGERERQQAVRGRPAVDGDSAGRDAPGADDCHLRRHDDEVLRANDGSQRFMKWPAPLLCRARLAELPGHRRNKESNSICQKETSRSPTNSHLSNQEDATKRQQCASVHLLRVSRRDASSIYGEKSAAIRFVEYIEVGS